MPGPVSATRDADLAVDLRRADVDRPTRGRELHRIREQVEDDLADPALVAGNDVGLAVRRERDLDAVIQRSLAHHHDAALERVPQRERRDFQLDLPGLDLGRGRGCR